MKIQNKSYFTKKKSAFTLVELIVVVVILAILGTIGFISYQGYSRSARNAKRISDINNIKTSLALFNTRVGRYPEPDNISDVIYRGAMVWSQGEVGDPVAIQLKELGKKPLDPLLLEPYVYSLLNTKKEYEVGCIYETDPNSITMGVSKKANAAEKLRYYSYIKGDYNGKVAQVSTGGTLYIFAVPSIIGAGLTDPFSNENFEYIVNNRLFTYDSYQNIPANYDGHNIEMTGSFNFGGNINDLLLFSGSSIEDLSNNYSEFQQFAINLQNAYSGSVLADNFDYQDIIQMNSSDAQDIVNSVGTVLTNVLGGELPEIIACATKPNYSNADFITGTVTVNNTPRQNSSPGNPCYYSCTGGYSGTQCNIGTCEAQNHGTTHTSYTIGSPATIGVTRQTTPGNPCYYTCTDGYSGNLCDIAPHYSIVYGTYGSGVVYDSTTGLYWTSGISPTREELADTHFCQNLSVAGFGGRTNWTIPHYTLTPGPINTIIPLDSNYFYSNGQRVWTKQRGDINSNLFITVYPNGTISERDSWSFDTYVRCFSE